MKTNKPTRFAAWACVAAAMMAPCLAGCQVSVGGQTLPSAYYLKDDVQYYPSGPEFKLTREAAALREAAATR